MSLIINHNLSALNTQRNLSGSGASMAKSIEKLSSGYKINVGGDDPSGLIISEQLRSQISGLERAVRNSSEAFNLIGIAEGALNEMNSILKKMRALAIHAANSGVTSPEQVAADQSEMDSGIETLNRIANTTRYSDQYLLNGQKQLVYDVTTSVNEPTDHSLLDTKMTRIDQVFKRDGVKMSIGFAGEKSQYQANTDTSAQRAYLEADNAYPLSEVDGANVTSKQEFILTGTSGSRLFSFSAGAHLGSIVESINNVRDSTGIGAALTFASDVRIDQTVNGTREPQTSPDYTDNTLATPVTGFDDGSYIYQSGDVQIYGAGLNNVGTAKISEFSLTPDAASSFKVGFNCDGDGKIYAKVVDKSTNSIEYYKDKDCTMLIGKGDDGFFAATNNSDIPSSPINNLDGIFMKLNTDNAQDLDVFEIAVIGQRLDNQKDMNVDLAGWSDTDNSVMSGVNLGVNTSSEGSLFYEYVPLQFESDGETVKTFEINVYMHESREPKYKVATSGIVENNIKVADPDVSPPQLAGQTVRVESIVMDNGVDSGLNITLNLPKADVLDTLSEYATVEELKASPEYQDLMEKLSTEQRNYAAIEDKYINARDLRDEAKETLEDAMKEIQEARAKEAEIRREIDRIKVRSIDDQMEDAERDLKLAQNDIMSEARDAIGAAAFADKEYRNVTAASPGAPEEIAEQMAEAVLDEIDHIVNVTKGDPTKYDWDLPANKTALMNIVKAQSPLRDLASTTPVGDPLWDDVDALLNAAYNAATDPELVKEVGDYAARIDELDGLELKYQNALKKLTDAETDFVNAVQDTVSDVGASWGTATAATGVPGGISASIQDLADEIEAALIAHIDGAVGPADPATGAAADPTIDFMRYPWSNFKESSGSVVGIIDTAIKAAGLDSGDIDEERFRALASDMFDSITGTLQLANYAEGVQKLKDNPRPNPADLAFTTGVDDEVETAMTRLQSDAGLAPVVDSITKWMATANNTKSVTWDGLANEISTAIKTELTTLVGVPTKALTAADVQTAIQGIFTGIAGGAANAAYPMLSNILDNAGGTAEVGVGTPGVPTELNAVLAKIMTDVTGAGSSLGGFIREEVAYWDANDNYYNTGLTAFTATAPTPADAAALDADVSAFDLVSFGNDAVEAAPGTTLGQEVSKALAEELLLLAQDGVLLNAANLNDTRTRDAMIERIMDAVPMDMRTGGYTGVGAGSSSDPDGHGIGDAALKQFIGEAYDMYVNNAQTAGGLANIVPPTVADPGYMDSYTQIVNDFAKIAEIYPGGGSLPRAEDRLERYGDRIEAAPAKAETNATTRKAWDRLVEEWGGGTVQTELEDIAAKFGKYVRKEIEDAANGQPIVWNDADRTDDILDELKGYMQGSKLWTKLQPNAADTPAQADEKAAALADFQKVIDKMYTSVTNPEYLGDVSELDNPPPDMGSKFTITSLAERYFDQSDKVKDLEKKLEQLEQEKGYYDGDVIDPKFDEVSALDEDRDNLPDGDLVNALHDASEEFGIIAKEADPILDKIEEYKKDMKDMLDGAKSSRSLMPSGNQTGSVEFINLGMRVFSVDYGSAETIRIQNKAGNLFYQYREADSMERLMVEPDKTVQVAGQDAQISLNGAPVFTTGLVADTTTPDFSGSLVFNAGTLGETSLAVAGYDVGKLYSKATSLQGVEENEAEIAELRRSFEPPSVSVLMGDKADKAGMLNENGNPVNLYMDFSQFDPSVEVKIANLGKECDIKVTFNEPDQLTINADSLGGSDIEEGAMTITVKVDPGALENGYYVTDPALKGLFIRTDNLVDLNMSGGDYSLVRDQIPSTVPSGGNAMLEVNTYATNPRSNTSESMENFLGGMQFQLGNTEGDQDRTVYSIQSMAMSELGRISWNGQEYCLQNVLGGGLASLSKDPILAMRVLAQAVDDVSTLRARLGAFQSNMLQSNINSLGVAIENITKTESAIRDTDMAAESTEFTRFQIMQQAGTSMLAQANQTSQNVLSLLQ